jgi:hypothetical protein
MSDCLFSFLRPDSRSLYLKEISPYRKLLQLGESHKRLVQLDKARIQHMVFKRKNGSKTKFQRNDLLATLSSNFQERQN